MSLFFFSISTRLSESGLQFGVRYSFQSKGIRGIRKAKDQKDRFNQQRNRFPAKEKFQLVLLGSEKNLMND